MSLKLYEWTGQRWIITLSKIKGEISVKDKEENKKRQIMEEAKGTELYKIIKEKFSDAKLIEITNRSKDEE